MVIKDYVCNECGYTEEFIFSFSVKAPEIPEVCPKCGNGKLEYKFALSTNVALNFIGEGFYCNDYGKKNFNKKSVLDHAEILE